MTGGSEDVIKDEVNRVLECIHAMMQDTQIAVTKQHVRLQFDLEGRTGNTQKCYGRSSSLPCWRM